MKDMDSAVYPLLQAHFLPVEGVTEGLESGDGVAVIASTRQVCSAKGQLTIN